MMKVKPIPDGFHSVTPYLIVEGVPGLIDFLKAAFEAKEIHRTDLPDGRVMHAQLQIGDSMVMMGEAMEGFPAQPADQFYGDRNAGVKDPTGNTWWIGTHVEDVDQEEIVRRAQAMGRG